MDVLATLLMDGYKVDHRSQYPKDTTLVYSNMTARAGRDPESKGVIFFGLQYFCQEWLQNYFDDNFFALPKSYVMDRYKTVIESYLGPGAITYKHIEDLHDLGYLPIKIKALPEGAFVPYGVPMLTIVNTKPEFFWLTNMLETLMSSVLWKMTNSATAAFKFRQAFQKYAKLTGSALEFVPWQGHDFSFRGMSGPEDAMRSGAAHLLSFTGTDSIPAMELLEQHYGASFEGLIGGSVPATEHSVMCMGEPDKEIETFRRLITEVYPKGIVSIVSDTWDYWKVITEYAPALKKEIMARDGKVVFRPDSGNPVHIICGNLAADTIHESRGTVESLMDSFGGKKNREGYYEVDSHVGVIYGDSINFERQEGILSGLAAKHFASSNVVLGMGSYWYQYTTRDEHGVAVKATYGETASRGGIAIYKDPLTDRLVGGTKKSHKGLLAVYKKDGQYFVKQECTKEEEQQGELQTVFENGNMINTTTLGEIRQRIEAQL